jgi:hypothetical protein
LLDSLFLDLLRFLRLLGTVIAITVYTFTTWTALPGLLVQPLFLLPFLLRRALLLLSLFPLSSFPSDLLPLQPLLYALSVGVDFSQRSFLTSSLRFLGGKDGRRGCTVIEPI